MAAESFAFYCPWIPQKAGLRSRIFMRCCVMKNDGTQAQVAKEDFQITSNFSNKVYEDQTKGILCYNDENGELVCEGYDDEGTRPSDSSYVDKDVMEVLQLRWLQLANDSRCTAEYSADEFLN